MRNSDGFLRHLRNHDVDDLFNDDALLNSLLRCVPHSSRPGQHRSFRHSPLWNHLGVLASGASVSSIILSESSSVYLDSLLHGLVGRGILLRHHVCRTTCVLDCLVHASLRRYFAVWALVWATHGLPVVRAPVYRECHCRDPLGCPPMPKQDGIVGGGGHVLRTSYTHAFFQQRRFSFLKLTLFLDVLT